MVLIEHFQKVKDRRIISQKIKRKGGGNGASYSLLFRHQLCIYTFPDSDLNTLINIVDSTTPTEHHQKLLIHFIQRKNRDHLFRICAIFLTTAVDMMLMMISDHEDDLTCSLSQLFHHPLARLLLKRIMRRCRKSF